VWLATVEPGDDVVVGFKRGRIVIEVHGRRGSIDTSLPARTLLADGTISHRQYSD
jgi:hypothetical protein